MAYQPQFPSYPHQEQAKSKMKGRKAFALLMAMRTGKTKTTIDDFGDLEFNGEVDDLLVLAPKGCYRTWKRELERHASKDLLQRSQVHIWESGGAKTHERQLRHFMRHLYKLTPRILIMNTEALSKKGRARDECLTFVSQRRCYVVVDESTMIKSIKAERSKFVIKKLAPPSSYRRILTGLPTPRDPLDVFGQFTFLDWRILGTDNWWEFRTRYADFRRTWVGNHWVDLLVAFKNLDHLHRKIEPHSFRCRLEDIVDLPAAYEVRHVEMTPEQERVYRSLRKAAIAELEGGKLLAAPLVITRMLRLHQVLMGWAVDVTGEVIELPEARTAALLELLEEYDGKAIIWASYDRSVRRIVDALAREYGKEAVAAFWGGNAPTREEEDKRFTTDPSCRFLVATPGSGGRGRKWDVANLVVYYSNTDNLEHRDQSEERAKDMEKRSKVMYVDLMVQGTVDEKFVQSLREKINLSATITGDNFREWLV